MLPTQKGIDDKAKPGEEFSEDEPFEAFNFLNTLLLKQNQILKTAGESGFTTLGSKFSPVCKMGMHF